MANGRLAANLEYVRIIRWRLPPRLVLPNRFSYLHLGKGLGVERLCVLTLTLFGPGFFDVREGRHFTLVAICITSLLGQWPAVRGLPRVVGAQKRATGTDPIFHHLYAESQSG